MHMENLRDLYTGELKDLYNAEKQLVKALPKMARNATEPSLKKAFADHLAQTETHVERLEQIFESLGTSPRGKRCRGMEGLIEEAKEMIEEEPEDDVLDAGLITKAQHVEHYEIAGYGTVRTYALTLGETEHAELLQQTLNEEKEADRLLTALAETSINIEAAIGEDATEDRAAETSRHDREVERAAASDDRDTRHPAGAGRKRGSNSATRETRVR